MNKKELIINIASNIISFIVTFGISFFLSPIIISNLGKEAYGFYTLGNQFISYASIVSTALNSMASRFIAIKIHENDIPSANRYYSSVFFSNLFLSLIFLLPSILIIVFLEVLLSIPNNIVVDVKLLWLLLFVNFIMSLLTNVFSVATYTKNKLYLSSLSIIAANIVKAITLIIAFLAIKPKLWYMGLSVVLYTIIVASSNYIFTRRLLPEMKLKLKNFNGKSVKDLLMAGMWNSINSLANVLNTGLTLLITNIFVGSTAMGDVSITKTFISAFFQLIAIFSSVFSPQLLKIYATENKESFEKNVKFSMRIIAYVISVIVGIFTVFGKNFYSLWLPQENAILLTILTILELLPFYFCGSVNIINEVMLIKNKMKNLALSYLIAGVINVLIVLISVFVIKKYNITFSTLDSDMICAFVIVGTTSVISIIRILTYVVFYSSKVMHVRKRFIYGEFIKEFIFTICIIVLSYIISIFIPANTWILFFVDVGLMCFVSLGLALLLLLDKDNRNDLYMNFNKIWRKK